MRYLSFIYGVCVFSLIIATMSPSFGAGDAWTLKFECFGTWSERNLEIKNINNIQSNITYNFPNGGNIKLDHSYKSRSKGSFAGIYTSSGGDFERFWYQYNISNSTLKGWGTLGNKHCSITGKKAQPTSIINGTTNINEAENISFICQMAFNYETGRWMQPSNGVYWYPYEVRGKFVNRAKRQGLSEQDCFLQGIEDLAKEARAKRDEEAVRLTKLKRQWLEEEAKRERSVALELNRAKEIERKRNEEALKLARRVQQEREEKAKRVAEAKRIKKPDAIAVIIGNRDYKGDTPDVEFAINDADAMREFVLNKLGYRLGNVIDLRDTSKAQIEETFGSKDSHKGRLFDYVRADESDVIVFYSGHGVPGLSDRRGYLLSVDANPNKAELTGYPVETLLKNLSKIPAKSMSVFIDACFSGNTPKGMLVNSMSGLTVEIRQPKKASKGMVVLTASRGDQVASWDKNAKHGLFTKHLLEALNGAADKQSKTGNKDGKVTLGEVKAYLDREMTYQARRRFSRDQHATVSGDLKTVLSAY